MPSICFYFQVHQPKRVKGHWFFKPEEGGYFDFSRDSSENNRGILEKVSRKCYLPTNALLLDLLKRHPEFKISFSFSGVVLEQFEEFQPEVLESFKALIDTGRVEILSETYNHSLSFLYSEGEFKEQIGLHREKIKEVFGVAPEVFRNTELIYSNGIAELVEKMGFKGVLAEGADHILKDQSPNFLYAPASLRNLKMLLKNYKLSDDIAFRFSDKGWKHHPLSAEKFGRWIAEHRNDRAEIINLFLDYETFGEHQWEESGIFKFLDKLPEELLKYEDVSFVTPSEAIKNFQPVAELDIPEFVSWADKERDLSAWRSNDMQHRALEAVYELESDVLKTGDPEIIKDWRDLQTSDHFYYMCTKYFEDGDVHKYFNPFNSPKEAHLSFMKILEHFKNRVEDHLKMEGGNGSVFEKESENKEKTYD